MYISKIIRERKATIVDVRTHQEFATGHVNGSVNIPLQEIPHRLDELKNFNQPIVVCCASGNRSRHACTYLHDHNIECYDGGSWMDINIYFP